MRTLLLTLFLFLCAQAFCVEPAQAGLEEQTLVSLLERDDFEAVKAYGAAAMPLLVAAYGKADTNLKTKIASAFYVLAIKSDTARDVLLADAHTDDPALRLQVQWALGRVSDDEVVVKTLLDNMRNDPNPLFRDKAACALANDQIHLTEKQRILLMRGVIDALEDDKPDVRRIAIQVLQIQTGQNKGYSPDASVEERALSVKRWRDWIAEYRSNIGA